MGEEQHHPEVDLQSQTSLTPAERERSPAGVACTSLPGQDECERMYPRVQLHRFPLGPLPARPLLWLKPQPDAAPHQRFWVKSPQERSSLKDFCSILAVHCTHSHRRDTLGSPGNHPAEPIRFVSIHQPSFCCRNLLGMLFSSFHGFPWEAML